MWLYVLCGGLVMLAGHLVLMWAIAGDPFHGFKVYFLQIGRDFIGGSKESDAFYYFRYLLFDLRYVQIVPYLSLAGLYLLLFRPSGADRARVASGRFVAIWLLGLIAVFSFTPISLSPVQLITKQSNYLNLFFAPMAIAAGVFIAALAGRWAITLVGIGAIGGILLAGLVQQDRRAFVANSMALSAYANSQPGETIFASVNNANVHGFLSLLGEATQGQVRTLAELKPDPSARGATVTVARDPVTHDWGGDAIALPRAPVCWTPIRVLDPLGFGAGRWVAEAGVRLSRFVPDPAGRAVRTRLEALTRPPGLALYKAPADNPWCSSAADPSEPRR
jgi:hypothetical protein